ncbi:glutathione S-transferase [Rhizorhabdus argentea]|uniref:glutathione S-transferase n=1 Tax=Rhizorhabdus argentea TaxID=1387174 RepID=UPI0030EF9D68
MAERPVLYSFRRCPYAMRARMALIVSGTICELREVKLSAKPPEMLALSPKGTVPVLLLPDGNVIDESLDIMRRALEANDTEGWLDGDDPELIANNDGSFKYHLDRYKYPGRHGSDPLEHRAAGLAMLAAYEAVLAQRDNLRGPRRRLADIAIMPFVRQFAETDRRWFDLQPLPALQAWLARHVESALFEAAMARFPPWIAGQRPVLLGWPG